jgi:hypothetical protein
MVDAYRIRARASPSLLLASPAMSLLVAVGFSSVTLGALSCGATAVLAVVLSEQVADMGRELEKGLFRSWGGRPTSNRLRLADATDLAATNARRAAVETATGALLPIGENEHLSPEEAMGGYDRAVDQVRAWLREDDANKILADVTASYGFRRNCLAIRSYGRATAAAGAILATVLWAASTGRSPDSFLAAALIDAVLCAFWCAIVTEAWVRRDAERYANQLFQTLLKNKPRHEPAAAAKARIP